MTTKTLLNPTRLHRRRAAFTLVEMLLVLVILAVLAAIVIPKMAGRSQQAKVTAAVTQIGSFKGALNMFEVENGFYPNSLDALVNAPSNAQNWKGPYLEQGIPADPWGNAYIYSYPGKTTPTASIFNHTGPTAAPAAMTTSPIGMQKSNPTAAGFTLIELIFVMVLLAVVAAFAAPSLSRSMRQRNLDGEATRFLAATEYARDEAVSQGVPMTVWINPTAQRFGVEAKNGYDSAVAREEDFDLNADTHFQIIGGTRKGNVVEAMEFGPDGSPTTASIDTVQFVDRFNSVISVSRTADGWSYEIVKNVR